MVSSAQRAVEDLARVAFELDGPFLPPKRDTHAGGLGGTEPRHGDGSASEDLPPHDQSAYARGGGHRVCRDGVDGHGLRDEGALLERVAGRARPDLVSCDEDGGVLGSLLARLVGIPTMRLRDIGDHEDDRYERERRRPQDVLFAVAHSQDLLRSCYWVR